MTETQIAQALHQRGLWQSTTAVAVVNGGRKIEIEMDTRDNAVSLLMQPLNINGQSVHLQEAVGDLIHVSLFNIPLGFPLIQIKDELTFYGHVHSILQQEKDILGRLVPVGTRIIKFFKLDSPIPKSVTIAGRTVRTVYSGQDEALTKLRHEQNTTVHPRPGMSRQQTVQLINFDTTAVPPTAAVDSENMDTDSGDDVPTKAKKRRYRRRKNAPSSSDREIKKKSKTNLYTPQEVVNDITASASTDFEEMEKIITFYYGEIRDPKVVAAEVLMAKYGRKAHADKSFPQLTHTTLADVYYDDPVNLGKQLAENYEAYLELHGELKS